MAATLRVRRCSPFPVATLRQTFQDLDPARRSGIGAPALVVAVIALCATVVGAWALRADDAAGAAAVVLGKTEEMPKPSCPTPRKDGKPDPAAPAHKRCQAVGEVTGLQVRADGVKNPFKVREDGRIVAWSVDLSKPHKSEIAFFSKAPETGPSVEAGVGWGNPSARISVLRKKKNGRYKLTKQGPKVGLKRQLGRQPIITLARPLRVRAGTFVAITTANWIPSLAHDPPAASRSGDAWVAGRGKKHCGEIPAGASTEEAIAVQQDMIDHSRPHRKVGSVRSYKCTYTAARLTYNAYLAPPKKKKDKDKGGGKGKKK